jgi:repressor of nif and glnA expression
MIDTEKRILWRIREKVKAQTWHKKDYATKKEVEDCIIEETEVSTERSIKLHLKFMERVGLIKRISRWHYSYNQECAV